MLVTSTKIDSQYVEKWLNKAKDSANQRILFISDFDGTLVKPHQVDSKRFEQALINRDKIYTEIFESLGTVPSICTSRTILEVKRICELMFNDKVRAESLYGFCAAETGAAILSPKLSQANELKLIRHGFTLVEVDPSLSVFSLAKVSPEYIYKNIIGPVSEKLGIEDSDIWAMSTLEYGKEGNLNRLYEMAFHNSIEETLESTVRIGSAYLKISDVTREAEQFAYELKAKAESIGIYALISPPAGEVPIWTVDFAGGVTKREAIQNILKAYSILSDLPEDRFKIAYFGDGENDLPAFELIKERPGHNWNFLVDSSKNNMDLFKQLGNMVHFTKDFCDIDGVLEGLKIIKNSL